MISNVKFSNLFQSKHKSPIGNPDGYYVTTKKTPVKKKKQNGKPTSTVR
jgi:hypothetical protein